MACCQLENACMYAIIVGQACEGEVRLTTLSKIKCLVSLRWNKSKMQEFMSWFKRCHLLNKVRIMLMLKSLLGNRVSPFTGLDHWTGPLDWITGLQIN